MVVAHPDLIPDLIDLIALCDKNPELANDIVENVTRYPVLQKKVLSGIPTCISLSKPISCKEIGRMVSATGSIIKTYPIFFKNVTSEQLCLKCNETTHHTEQELARRSGNIVCLSCGSANLKITQDFQHSFPTQTIKIQDISSSTSMSETIELCIEGEKAGSLKPGDKVSVTGIVLRKWKAIRPNEPLLSTLYIKVLHILKDTDDEEEYLEVKAFIDNYLEKSRFEKRSFIIGSFCPELYGLENVKLGILLSLIGGTSGSKDPGDFRQNSHVLLTGDPGTGKSHLLKAASKLVTPSVFTNGVGTSDAGLTSCAVKYGKEWALEAGALVLADTGICCIDEFNRLKVSDRSGLLEAMEQQTLSVAKAGIVATLNSRCSVLAAAGVHGGYNRNKSLCENLNLTPPLVSRFDLTFGIFQKPRSEDDKLIADCLLDRDTFVKLPDHIRWTQPTLRAFISQCRKKKNRASEEICDVLLKYYTKRRILDGVSEFNTVRLLESLVRLAESHSKLMGEDVVTIDDAVCVIMLMETCISTLPPNGTGTWKAFVNEESYQKVINQISNKYSLGI